MDNSEHWFLDFKTFFKSWQLGISTDKMLVALFFLSWQLGISTDKILVAFFLLENWQLGILIDKMLVAHFFKYSLAKTTENHFSNKILVAFFFF